MTRELLPHHRKMLEQESGIDPDVITERGYRSVERKVDLEAAGFGPAQRLVPSLLIPVHTVVSNEPPWYLHRPDEPRIKDGRTVKYEIPRGRTLSLDVPPRSRPYVRDPSVPLFVTEGAKKVDSLLTAGAKAVVGVVGVWAFRGTAPEGGKALLPDWQWIALKDGREVYVAYDSDVMLKEPVQMALDTLYAALNRMGASTRFIYLPHGPGGAKQGVDDYLASGRTLADVLDLATTVKRRPPRLAPSTDQPPDGQEPLENVQPIGLAEGVEVFKRWLHLPDPEPVYVILGAVASNRLPGDPVWLLIVGASGGGKTELVVACTGLPECVPISTLTEPGLLSGTPRAERAAHATGGVLRQIGALGIIVAKDFTSLLAMQKDSRNAVLGALREVYDGHYPRPIGAEGGQTLHWWGKAGLIGGVTFEIDRQHAVMARMGERLLLYRLPEATEEVIDATVKRALENRELAKQMREELRRAAAGVIAGLPEVPDHQEVDVDARAWTIELAKFTARARAGVIYDGSGNLVDVVPPEMPTRLALELEGLRVGMLAIGVPADTAARAVSNVAFGCIPGTRAKILRYLADGETRSTTDVQVGVEVPNRSAYRELEALVAHKLALNLGKQEGAGNALHWKLREGAVSTLKRIAEVTQQGEIGGSGGSGETVSPVSPEVPHPPISPNIEADNGQPADDNDEVAWFEMRLEEDRRRDP